MAEAISKDKPQNKQETRFEFNSYTCPEDQTRIRYGTIGFEENPNHVLIFLPGRSEWIEKYEFLYEDICEERGWGYLSIDHRGQGASGGKAAHVDNYDLFVRDVEKIIKRELKKGKTYSILAHSMGGLISLYGVLKGVLKPEKLSLSAPLLGLPQKPIPRVLALPLAIKMCKWGFSKTDTAFGRHEIIPYTFNKLTTDRAKYKLIQNSPYKIPGPTFGWVKASFKATTFIFHDSNIGKLSCPVQIQLGSREGVVDPKSIEKWVDLAQKIAPNPVSLHTVKGAKHELLFEAETFYNEVLENVNRFL